MNISMQSHSQRITQELKAAGVTWYGMKKFAIKYLPKTIRQDEHIKGVVYGRYKEKDGPSYNEGVLIATDLRVMFLDHKPGYTKTDEIGYDSVSGVRMTITILASVTLHTRLGEFSLRFANVNCARIFVRYIESRKIADKAVKSSWISLRL